MKWVYENSAIVDEGRIDGSPDGLHDGVVALVEGTDADGRLMAAAPDMLAALEMIAGLRPCADALMGNIDIALSAIAKAKGKVRLAVPAPDIAAFDYAAAELRLSDAADEAERINEAEESDLDLHRAAALVHGGA